MVLIQYSQIVHDDGKHSGSAKRNAANGLAGLNASSKLPDSILEKPVGTHEADTSTHGVVTVADAADLTTHEADTTAIHGIVDSSKLSVIGSDTYTTDNTTNKAITHGLGVTPKIILLTSIASGVNNRIFGSHGLIFYMPGNDSYVVTIPNATYFYVGNATNYTASANSLGDTVSWVAFG